RTAEGRPTKGRTWERRTCNRRIRSSSDGNGSGRSKEPRERERERDREEAHLQEEDRQGAEDRGAGCYTAHCDSLDRCGNRSAELTMHQEEEIQRDSVTANRGRK